MMRFALALLLAPLAPLAAQQVTIASRGDGRAAAIVDSVRRGPHALRAGRGDLVLPRDSTVTTSLLVLGRPTYLASRVQGDVVVVGADLFLRPGADISGRAIAIGGTVAATTLGTVGGGIESLQDETLRVRADPSGGYTLVAENLRVEGETPGIFRLAGIRGVGIPAYDRVNGLSLPVGVQIVPNEHLVIEPSLTYRSRLGVVDPGVTIFAGVEEGKRFEGRAGRVTRTNDAWINGDIVNSLKSFALGSDTRNYFRADGGEGRFFLPIVGDRASVEPFAGARYERVFPISGTGTVWSMFGRSDTLKMARPNPLVESGHIASALAGLRYKSLPEDAPVTTRLALEAEQSFTAPAGTSNFTQITADGRVEFPTIRDHRLRIDAHAVGTVGGAGVTRARYAYLGGSGTLRLNELLELGGTQLLYVESRYLVPLSSVQLPIVGEPLLFAVHKLGGAGVGSLGSLEQEVGLGVRLASFVDVEWVTGASGQGRSAFGVSLTLPAF